MESRSLVVGLGALGGVVAATLTRAGAPVEAWARRPEVRERARRQSLLLRDGRGAHAVRLAVVDEPDAGAYAFVFLAIPPDAVADAARTALPLLRPDGCLVPLANGLPEERLTPFVPERRLIGAVVDLSASAPAPGVVARSATGTIAVGRLSGSPDARVAELVRLLAPLGEVRATRNLRGARWAKLALNSAFSSMVAASGERVGSFLHHAFARRLALAVFGEAQAVAAADGVVLDVNASARLAALGLPPGAGPGWPVLLARHLRLLAGAWRYRHSRSSMLAQLRRGLVPPVGFLNGELVDRGARRGIGTPANQALLEGVLAIGRGEAESSLATLRRIAAAAGRPRQRDAEVPLG